MKQRGQIIRMHNGNSILDYSGENLQGCNFKRAKLQHADFTGADLRGADFSFANLSGAHFVKTRLGIRKASKVLLFLCALVLSLISGYIAMLAGSAFEKLIRSADWQLQVSGYILLAFFLIFTVVALRKGLDKAISKVLVVLIAFTAVLGVVMYATGIGTGMGAVYGALALVLMALMFVVGTVARSTIGTLGSNFLFLLVAVGGSIFGRSVGGGVGTIIMAVACALISKRALKEERDALLSKIALTISTYLGTSFKHADLREADFSEAEIKNTNFSHANLNGVNWNKAQKLFTLENSDP